jgi:hypothetical protein
LEDRLHALIVNGKLDLETAQREIATDWIAAYKKYVGPSPISGHHRLVYTGVGLNGSAPPDSPSEEAASAESSPARENIFGQASNGTVRPNAAST